MLILIQLLAFILFVIGVITKKENKDARTKTSDSEVPESKTLESETLKESRMSFHTIINDGKDQKWTSTCMFISVRQALMIMNGPGRLDKVPTVGALREIAGFPDESIQFDNANPVHSTGLQKIVDHFDLCIWILPVQREGGMGSCWIKSDGVYERYRARAHVPVYNRFSIVCFNGHFELIVSCTSHTGCIIDKAQQFDFKLSSHKYVAPGQPKSETQPPKNSAKIDASSSSSSSSFSSSMKKSVHDNTELMEIARQISLIDQDVAVANSVIEACENEISKLEEVKQPTCGDSELAAILMNGRNEQIAVLLKTRNMTEIRRAALLECVSELRMFASVEVS